MNDEDRGKIRNREYAQQIRDFSGLRYGDITPTDIDAFLDFGDKCFVFIEAKHGDAALPFGQQLALERLCNASADSGKHAVLIIARHDTPGDIDVANLPVKRIYYERKWTRFEQPKTVRFIIDGFLERMKAVEQND